MNRVLMLGILVVLGTGLAQAATKDLDRPGAQGPVSGGRDAEPDRVDPVTRESSQEPIRIFSAIVIDPESVKTQQAVTVKVELSGIELTDPAKEPAEGRRQGHLHYQMDQGPVLETAATQVTFRDLTPGTHTVTVQLSDQYHQPVGPPQILSVTIP